jgi:hypothetical protein
MNENERKRLTDNMASKLLELDPLIAKKMAISVAKSISNSTDLDTSKLKVVVCGAAGSGKSTFARELSKELGVKAFDLDEFIPGGFTDDQKVYRLRLVKGWSSLWDSLPARSGWIVEHVEACHNDFVGAMHPDFAVYLNPGEDHLKLVASARDAVGEFTNGKRKNRALQSNEIAKRQFDNLGYSLRIDGLGKQVSLKRI